MINCAYIGMILSVSRYVKEQEEQRQKEEEEKQRLIQENAVAALQNAAMNLMQEQNTVAAQKTEVF